MRLTYLLICISVSVHVSAPAQDTFAQNTFIDGVILDPSQRPVENALVECAGRTAASGPDGRFRITGIPRCAATIRREGFATLRTNLVAGAATVVQLSVESLKQVLVVSAARTPITPEAAGVDAAVIGAADLTQRNHPQLRDVLREQAGVSVAMSGRTGGATQVFIRGAPRTGTLVLIEGIPVNDPGGDLNFAHLQTSDIDHVEIVRGSASSLFGATGAAGVIQLLTKRGDSSVRRPHGLLSYERGSFQTDRWIAGLNGGSGDRLDYALNAEQLHTVSEFPNDFYRNTTGSANLGYRLRDRTQVRTILRSFDSAVGVPNRVGYGIYDPDANRANRDYLAGLRVEDHPSARFGQQFFLNYHRLKDTFNDPLPNGPFPVAALVRDSFDPVPRVHLVRLVSIEEIPSLTVPAGTRLRRPTPVRLLATSSVSVTSRARAGYQGTLAQEGGVAVFGYEYERQDGRISGGDVGRDTHALFGHKQHTFRNRLSISGGARLERNSAFGVFFSPRLSGSYRFGAATFLHAGMGRGFTEPSLLQNFARESTFTGNPDLKPEKTTAYEAGLLHIWAGGRIRSEVTAFRNSFRDLFVFRSLSATSGTFQNIDSAWARGVQLSIQGRLREYIVATASYTRLHTRVVNSSNPTSTSTGIGQELQRRPKNAATFSLSVAPSRWFFQCSAAIIGERQEPADLFGVTRNAGYATVAAGGSYRLSAHVSPFIRADNLLNQRYMESLGFSSLSRSVRGGLRLQW